jgi:HEAT repeat protein
MTDDRMSAPTPEMAKARITPVEARRFQIGVRALVVLVGCCGILLWALRHLWESSHPASGAARGLQARSPSERVDAARELMRIGIGDSHDAIPPLVSALNDPEAEVRAAAAESLKTVASVAVNAGSAHDLVQESIAALIGSLNDRESAVRMAVVDALATILASRRGGEVVDLESVFAAFTEMLGDPVANIRIAALNGLGTTARMLAVEPPPALAALLDDESDVVRATALRSVACFQRGLDAWIPMILRALDRDSESVVGQTLPVEVGALRPPAFSAPARRLPGRAQADRDCFDADRLNENWRRSVQSNGLAARTRCRARAGRNRPGHGLRKGSPGILNSDFAIGA